MIFWFDSLDSTNNTAKMLQGHIDNLAVIAAECQSGGRGQGDHLWSSEPGANLTFSVVLEFDDGNMRLRAKDAVLLTHIATWAIRKFLGQRGVESRIKWPNDIYVGDKKLCGILIENTLCGHDVRYSVIGVGLNLNQTVFPSDLPNPVSLCQLTGDRYDIICSLTELEGYFWEAYKKASTSRGCDELRGAFEEALFYINNEERR